MFGGNYKALFTMAYIIKNEELPSKGNFPVVNKNRITPQAQTSTAGLFILVFLDKIYGGIYRRVPQSAYGLK